MKLAMSLTDKVRAGAQFIDVKLKRRPLTVSIEVTKRCNARCDFCDYWKSNDRDELGPAEFADTVRHFEPLVVVFTGGEPLIRKDLLDIVKAVKAVPGYRYMTLLTHGGFLNEKKVKELVAAGINQINVSLNYPDDRQDKERGIPGLFARLDELVPRMVRDGVGGFALSSMLMLDNMHAAEPLIRLAHRWGVNIAFSGYNDVKNGNQNHFVPADKMAEFKGVCEQIKKLKRELGNVMASDYFFDRLPEFYEKREIPGCRAGQIMVHISPKGMVQPCAELEPVAYYKDFISKDYPGPNCGKCFDSCRAEPEAPLTLRRMGELTGLL